MNRFRIVGAGLAGCEAALTLANFGCNVDLFEMKPKAKTPAQKLDGYAELVCSNSFRSTKKNNAVALLKDEMLLLKSPLMQIALSSRVPAGDSLAIDREVFSQRVSKAVHDHPKISVTNEEVKKIPTDDIPTIFATGPLTSDVLAKEIQNMLGQEHLDFYDAIAPIIESDSIDLSKGFFQNRWQDETSQDFLNCPLTKEEYENFVDGLLESEKTSAHNFEDAKYFEGCLPIEIMAKRGRETLRFGPFKPVGLFDPNSNQRAHAVLQLRKEDRFGNSYNLVGCQTRMTIPEQKKVFGQIPALANAKFLRFGSIHRNTYVNSPLLLDQYLRVKANSSSNIFFAGQITGVEGYVESMACGLIVARLVFDLFSQNIFTPFPEISALGGLYRHILGINRADEKRKYVPSNVNWSMLPPIKSEKRIARAKRRELLYERGLNAMTNFLHSRGEIDSVKVA